MANAEGNKMRKRCPKCRGLSYSRKMHQCPHCGHKANTQDARLQARGKVLPRQENLRFKQEIERARRQALGTKLLELSKEARAVIAMDEPGPEAPPKQSLFQRALSRIKKLLTFWRHMP